MKRVREFGFYGILISLALSVFSCNKTNTSTDLMDDEQRALKQYILVHDIKVPPLASGLYYLPSDTGNGIKPQPTDIVLFDYTLRLINGFVVSTNVDTIAKKNTIFNKGVFYNPLEYRLSWWFAGLYEGFQLMNEGETATFILPSNLAYGTAGNASNNIGSYTPVIFDIHLLQVIHDPVAYEKAQIEKYVLDSIPLGKSMDVNDSGVYHIIDIAGTGDSTSTSGKIFSILYTAKLLDGRVIDKVTSTASPFSVTLGTTSVIAGFEQAIKIMKKGESAWVIIPYKQAYGERPSNLPAFSTLIYYMTIQDIQ